MHFHIIRKPQADAGVHAPVLLARSSPMPIILWLLGVPLGIIILLMLFGVVSF